MISWWKKKIPSMGVVLFRGDLPDRLENYRYLEQMGVSILPLPGDADNVWGMTLRHPEWGEAEVLCRRNFPRPAIKALPYYRSLSEEDREAIRAVGTGLLVTVAPQHGNILRDRKLALLYFQALMGSDGVAAYDMHSYLYWTPEMLADELCHDADLDVEALYSLHELHNEGAEHAYWIHSHGLQEIGYFDFSILNPSQDLPSDLYRSLVYNIIEGTAKIGEKFQIILTPQQEVMLTDMRIFLQQGDPAAVALIRDEMDEFHRDNAAVLCEPQSGWLSRFFAKGICPSRVLSKGLPENCMLPFSSTASRLMSERARGTYPVFRRIWEELTASGLPMPALAKVGYVTDNGGPDDKEHLWFEVKGFTDSALDAELVNQPYGVARLKQGDRGMHAVEQLSDWVIMTPLGQITPRNAAPARTLRSLPPKALDELRTLLQETCSD